MSKMYRFRDWIGVAFGASIMAAGFGLFLVPEKITTGGVMGISTLLHYSIGMRVGFWSLLLNIPLFILGVKVNGRAFLLKSLLGMALLSMLVDVFRPVLTHDRWLSTVFGAVLVGFGLGITQRSGGSTGGSDLLARILHIKYPHLGIASTLFVIDITVVSLTGIAFHSVTASLVSLVALFISFQSMEASMNGLQKARCFLIVTEKPEDITRFILLEIERGCTRIEAKGGYSQHSKQVLLCVVQRQQVMLLKRLVAQQDPQAFVVLLDAHEVLGEGFLPKL